MSARCFRTADVPRRLVRANPSSRGVHLFHRPESSTGGGQEYFRHVRTLLPECEMECCRPDVSCGPTLRGPRLQAKRLFDARQERRCIVLQVERGCCAHGIARVIPLILELPLPELRSGRIPGELEQAYALDRF